MFPGQTLKVKTLAADGVAAGEDSQPEGDRK